MTADHAGQTGGEREVCATWRCKKPGTVSGTYDDGIERLRVVYCQRHADILRPVDEFIPDPRPVPVAGQAARERDTAAGETDTGVPFAVREAAGRCASCRGDLDADCGHHSWAGLMALLDEHWPADIWPTLHHDDPARDAGARIISLMRWVDELRGGRA